MIPQDASVEGAPTFNVSGRELIQEEACSFKAVMATQYITDVLEAIKLGDFLQKLAEAQATGNVEDIIRARDLQTEIDQLQADLSSGNVQEQDKSFLETDIEKKKALRIEILADVMREQAAGPGRYYGMAADALPLVFKEAPELIYKFCALMMIPNDELEKLFKKGHNGIKKEVEKNKQWLMFHTLHWQPLEIANFFLPAVGLDVLKKVGMDLVMNTMSLMTAEEEEDEETQTSSDTLSKSSSPNLELVETS